MEDWNDFPGNDVSGIHVLRSNGIRKWEFIFLTIFRFLELALEWSRVNRKDGEFETTGMEQVLQNKCKELGPKKGAEFLKVDIKFETWFQQESLCKSKEQNKGMYKEFWRKQENTLTTVSRKASPAQQRGLENTVTC